MKKNKPEETAHASSLSQEKGIEIPRVALSINLDSTYGRDKLSGVLAYLKRRPRWDIPLVNDRPYMSVGDLKRWKGDGIIGEFYISKDVEAMAALGIPIVNTVDTVENVKPSSTHSIPTVFHDESKVGKVAAQHLSILQRSVCLYFEVASPYCCKKRLFYFQQEILARGGRVEVHWIKIHQNRAQVTDFSHYLEAIQSHAEPICVFAATDRIALGVIRACHVLNRKIPEEVAILGCGNDKVICQVAQPQLSSIDQKTQEIGYRAAEMLDQLMGRGMPGDKPLSTADNPEIFVRESSDSYALLSKEFAVALQFLREHSNESIYVPDVVRVSGVSRRTLEGLFQKYLGCGIYQEIRSGRIATAKRLLATTTLSLAEISRRSGFNNISALEAAIVQKFGCTGGELRAKLASS
jgi:LacI family transcriptional regulator